MIRIITDSASDITQEEASKLGITIIPLKTRFGSKEYLDGVDITIERFYDMLVESDELPTTSCPSPVEFEEIFEQYKDDEVVCILLSSKLSGTYQSALIGKGDKDNIYLVDSLSASPGQRILVYKALRYVKDGLSVKEITQKLEEDRNNVVIIAMLETLEYLKKGGRISSSAAAVGSLLGIKPVITIKDGEIAVLGKARGSKKAQNLINETIVNNNGINFDEPYNVAYAGNSRYLLDKYIQDSKELFQKDLEFEVDRVGSTIGTHIGPGAIALSFIKNK